MSRDLQQLLRSLAPEGGEPDLAQIRIRSRRYGSRRRIRALGVAAALPLVVWTGVGVVDLDRRSGPIPIDEETTRPDEIVVPVDVPLDQRAATVAIAAVHEAGLADPNGTYFDYGEVREGEITGRATGYIGGWLVHLCGEPPTSGVCTHRAADSGLVVEQKGEGLVVTDAWGGLEPHALDLVGYSEPVNVFSVAHVYTGPYYEMDPAGGAKVSFSTLWTGPIPSRWESECAVKLFDEDGQQTWTRDFPQDGPSVEGARDGVLTVGVPERDAPPTAEIECLPWEEGPKRERPVLPEGEGMVLAGVVLPHDAAPEWAGSRLQLHVYSETERYCYSVFLGGQRQESTCSPRGALQDDVVLGWGWSQADEGTDGLASGQVRADITRVEFRFSDGRVVEVPAVGAPDDMNIPIRYFLAYLPDMTDGVLVALDSTGEPVARKTFEVRDPLGD